MTQPLPGDFCIVPVSGPLGTLISMGEWAVGGKLGRHDHAAVYIGGGKTASAYPNGEGIRPAPISGAVWSTGKIKLTDRQRNGIVTWCDAHPRVRYSWEDYAAISLHRCGVDAAWLRRYINGTGSMICSQYTALAYLQGGGVNLFPGRWPGYVTPEDLAELISA